MALHLKRLSQRVQVRTYIRYFGVKVLFYRSTLGPKYLIWAYLDPLGEAAGNKITTAEIGCCKFVSGDSLSPPSMGPDLLQRDLKYTGPAL